MTTRCWAAPTTRGLMRRIWATARPHRGLMALSLAIFPLAAGARAAPALSRQARHRRLYPRARLGRSRAHRRALHGLPGRAVRAARGAGLRDAAHRPARDPRPARDAVRPSAVARCALLRQEPGGPADDARAQRRGGDQRAVHQRRGLDLRRRADAHRGRGDHARDELEARARGVRPRAGPRRAGPVLPRPRAPELPRGAHPARPAQRLSTGIAHRDDGDPALRARGERAGDLRPAQRGSAARPVPVHLLRRLVLRDGGDHGLGGRRARRSGTAAARSSGAP